MNNMIKDALSDLFKRHNQLWQKAEGDLPIKAFDEQWQSPCQVRRIGPDNVSWTPIEREVEINLQHIEEALEVTLHPSIHTFFCSYYAAGIPCLYDDQPIELIQAWNEDDFRLLQENMIAHFLMQKRLKKPASMFIASCHDEMQIISILNDTGEVQLETLGKKQEAVLAPNLALFLNKLQPVVVAND